MDRPQTEIDPRVDEITTDWEIVRDPPRFVLRYAPAIQKYVRALIKNRHDAEEVAQDFSCASASSVSSTRGKRAADFATTSRRPSGTRR